MSDIDGNVRCFQMRDGASLAYRHWAPADARNAAETRAARPIPRGAVVAIHGIQSHSAWYAASCARMAQAGFDVCFLDRRGSGLNRHARGDLRDWRVARDDLAEVLAWARRRMGGRPVHLQAISWGAKLATAMLIERPELADSLMLIGPALVPRVDITHVNKLKVVFALATSPAKRFDVPLDDPHLFTENPPRVRYIAEDPLSLRTCTARFLLQTRRLDRFVRRNASRLRTPVLLMLAGRDRIVDNDAVMRLAKRFASRPSRVMMYENASHTLEFEPDPEPIFGDMIAWLEER